ncbi:MAG TPA: alpha/beta fold hydrolase [Candidatus Saccharimonadales bacterium]|nr:alpha/beta fold hydrolase [Candidatus Saccharimonadales bacterium]
MYSENITFSTVNNQKLKGMIIFPNDRKEIYPAILFIHGWMSNMKGSIPRAEALAKLGYISLLFDLRGHGESDGTLGEVTAQGSLEDAIVAYDYLASLPKVEKEKISVIGSSYGGYTAALLVAKRPISSLVLRVPALYRNETFDKPKVKEIRKTLRVYRQSEITAADNYALKAISLYTNPLLLIESENDELVPHQTIENYRKAINPETRLSDIVMPDVDHSLSKPKWRQDYIDILVRWFKNSQGMDK